MTLFSRFFVWTLDVDAVARALVRALLDDYAPAELEPQGAQAWLRTRYMRLVADYGLPAGAVDTVSARAWALIVQARELPILPETPFAFYE